MSPTPVRRVFFTTLATLVTLAGACQTAPGDGAAEESEQGGQGLAVDESIPGLVMGLRHNLNQIHGTDILPSALDFVATPVEGGDLGAPNHRGYEWLMARDQRGRDPASLRLPPGVVVALKHNRNTRDEVTAFGHDPVTGPASFPGFVRQVGGDRGAPSGVGYFWYESTGAGFTDWASVQNLPRMAVVGLKHTGNQPGKFFVWNGVRHDAGNPNGPVPAGFARVCGGDLGAPSGMGYCWFERTEGADFRGASRPTFQFSLPVSMFAAGEDADRDGLNDAAENVLAEITKPFLRFDSLEVDRQPDEPLTLFRVFPNRARSWADFRAVTIRWVFLFKNDGGYGGSDLVCGDDHPGDNDTATWDLQSVDGITWFMTRMRLGINGDDRSLTWPEDSGRIEVRGLTHPVIYMSQGKHHEYFNRDRDTEDSFYSLEGRPLWICNDDVDGQGMRFLPSLVKLGRFHNVGEPDAHLIGALEPFPGEHAWGTNKFLGGGNPNLTNFTKILP